MVDGVHGEGTPHVQRRVEPDDKQVHVPVLIQSHLMKENNAGVSPQNPELVIQTHAQVLMGLFRIMNTPWPHFKWG